MMTRVILIHRAGDDGLDALVHGDSVQRLAAPTANTDHTDPPASTSGK